MTSKIVITLISWVLMSSATAWGADMQLFQERLNGFISEALENNPELQEARAKVKAIRETPSQAGALSDPMLEFEIMNLPVDTFSFSREDMTQKQISLSQQLAFPGKLGLKTAIAYKDVELVERNLDELKLQIVREIKLSYYELCFIKASIETTERNHTLLKHLITTAEAKYSVGKGLQQDVLKAQVELSQNSDELIRLQKQKKVEEARLNTLMNRPPQTTIDVPHGIVKNAFNHTIENLQKLAEENRPYLNGLTSLIERSRVSKNLAKREYYPDFGIGFRYGQRQNAFDMQRPDFVSAFVSINIPIWYKDKQSRKVAEESHKVDVAQEAYKSAKNQVYLQIKENMDELTKNQKLLELIQTGIIPQAKQSLESALAGYAVDKVDFLTLLSNQMTLFNWEVKYHRELTDYEKSLARMEHIVGKTLY